MSGALIEHVNVTVTDPDRSAALLCELFGWHVRWQGDAIHGGRSVHVGRDDAYLALYAPTTVRDGDDDSYVTVGGMNHIGIVVDDLEAAEQRVLAAGFRTHNHGDYEPGRRFYFNDRDGIEYEVVHYPTPTRAA